ncbi:MAG: DNA-binding protein [Myxococcales bacterium]|nr:DNA-binding protein [Myxococcales bacterium]
MGSSGNGNTVGERLLTVKDVAEFLQMSPSWVYKRAEAGLLPVRRFGGRLRFAPGEIRAYASGEWQPLRAVMAVTAAGPGRRSA